MNPLPTQPSSGNFMDRNTLIALVLVMLMFIGWQTYMDRTYPPVAPVQPVSKEDVGDLSQNPEAEPQSSPEILKDPRLQPPKEVIYDEQLVSVDGQGFSVELSSLGMGFRTITLGGYSDRSDHSIELGDPAGTIVNFGLYWQDTGEALSFSIERVGDFEFVGVSRERAWTVTRRLQLDPETFSARAQTEVEGDLRSFPGLKTIFADDMKEREKNFLFPSFEYQDVFAISEGKEEREMVDPEDVRSESGNSEFNLIAEYGQVTLASLSRQYFALAVLDNSPTLPSVVFKGFGRKNLLQTELLSRPLSFQPPFVVDQIFFFGAKSLPLLTRVHEEMPAVMDLGFFASLARPLLRLLQFFHGFVHNWGLAIIALTLLVRLILLPLNISSFRSMKKMQLLQEPMKVLREKYKDDRQKMNEEVAALFKKEKVNPIGGCLPMILQLPIFLALYQVFSKSIELYQAPFIFWIQDLSSKDPYYVLPVLMGLTMFLQQLLTPSTMDPAQKKIMLFIPVVFSLMMVTLPSGLTLYIFVSTLFGVIQQLLMTRDSASAVAAPAKA